MLSKNKYTDDSLSKLSFNELIKIILRFQKKMDTSIVNPNHTREDLLFWPKTVIIKEIISIQNMPTLPKIYHNDAINLIKYYIGRNKDYAHIITTLNKKYEEEHINTRENVNLFQSQKQQLQIIITESEKKSSDTIKKLNNKINSLKQQVKIYEENERKKELDKIVTKDLKDWYIIEK
tara:strand:+ start:101 stop:634 length:534 start_codon:yes stop_codon:yes gene_type:complete